ncbi:MAG TPA: transcriptional repressor [Bordetella sp.]
MKVLEPISDASILTQLLAVKLKATASRMAVLRAMQRAPERWTSSEGLYRECIQHGEQISIGNLYRILNELAQHGLLVRETDDNGKRFYRIRPAGSNPALHKIECHTTGDTFQFVDETLREHVARALRDRSLLLTESVITVQVQCVRG